MMKNQNSDRSDTILDSAEKFIRKGGFNAVSFRDIADDIGIKSSSVHYHFPKKTDLGKAVIDRYAKRFLESLGSPEEKKETPQTRINRLGKAYLAALEEDDAICLGCILGAESAGLPGDVQEAVGSFFDGVLRWTSSALAGSKGPSASATHIIGALQGAMVLSVATKKPDALKETIRRLQMSV
ncbi:MAG: TetR/AcrR family transcriptional regulator [Sneathiellales bacterium]|nr:TetR/AcrR family transcriptional regulator [Sneathiellales bacterium]